MRAVYLCAKPKLPVALALFPHLIALFLSLYAIQLCSCRALRCTAIYRVVVLPMLIHHVKLNHVKMSNLFLDHDSRIVGMQGGRGGMGSGHFNPSFMGGPGAGGGDTNGKRRRMDN